MIIITSESIWWIDADGGTFCLTDGVKYNVLAGMDGRWMPPFEFITDEVYAVPGDFMRLRKTKPREVTLPIVVMGATAAEFRTNMRFLVDAFDPVKGDGFLKVITPDNLTLLLKCHYSDGMTAPENYDTGSSTFRTFVATFTANNPFWFNALENERIIQGIDLIRQSNTIENTGNVDTWPLWVISGPLTSGTTTDITIRNNTTGKALVLSSLTINTYSVLYIDTRPDNVFVYRDLVDNYFHHMAAASNVFPLVPGINQIACSITGGSGDNFIKCRWVDRYYGV